MVLYTCLELTLKINLMKILLTIILILISLDSLLAQSGNIKNSEDVVRINCVIPIKGKFLMVRCQNYQTDLIINRESSIDSTLTLIFPKWIKEIKVVSGEKAIEMFGESAEDGVVIIELKKSKFKFLSKEVKQNFKSN